MKCRDQGGAFSAVCDVAATKIGDGADAGELGQYIGIADLKGEWGGKVGAVTQGLAMAADGADLIGADTCLADHLINDLGLELTELDVELAQLIDLAVARLGQLEDLLLELFG